MFIARGVRKESVPSGLAALLLLSMSALIASAQGVQRKGDEWATEKAEIRTLFETHNNYFSRGDAHQISLKTIQAPAWIGLAEVVALQTPADVEERFAVATAVIREQGYDHSEILGLDIRMVNRNAAVVDMTFRRFLKNGEVLGTPTRRATYTVLRTSSGWRIVTLSAPLG